MSDEALKSE